MIKIFEDCKNLKDCAIDAYKKLQDKAVKSGEDSLELVSKPEEVVGYYLDTYGDDAFDKWKSNLGDKTMTSLDKNVDSYFKSLKECKNLKENVNMDKIEYAMKILRDAGYDVDRLEMPNEVIKHQIKSELSKDRSIEEMKDFIWLIYDKDRSGYLTERIEEFVSSHGVSEDSDTIFEGLSDKDTKELYNSLYDLIVRYYDENYENMDTEIIEALGLSL